MRGAGADTERSEGQVDGAGPVVLAGGYALRLATFFSALFVVAGTKLPYLPIWLDWRGLAKPEIAMVTAAPLFLRIVAGPMIAMVADRWGERRQAAILLSALALGAVLLLGLAQGFWSILAVVLIGALAAMGLMPIAETLAMSGVRRGGLDYGRMRLWGSVSFIAIGFAAGPAITAFGAQSVLWLLIAGSVVTLGAALLLPPDPDAGEVRVKRRGLALTGRSLLVPHFLLFLAAAGVAQSSHAVFYTFGVIEWQRQGLSTTWCAVLWAVGVVAEIGLFAFSRVVAERIGAIGLLMAGAVAGLVRWTMMAFDPPLAVLLPLQSLHGLTFGAAHLGALHFMSKNVAPTEAATAQALYASVTSGIGLGLATLAAGPLYAALGGRAYLAMAALGSIGAVATLGLWRLEAGKRQF
ncbi:MAG: MFS transporter [Hyphomicrobiaceae bacterium]